MLVADRFEQQQRFAVQQNEQTTHGQHGFQPGTTQRPDLRQLLTMGHLLFSSAFYMCVSVGCRLVALSGALNYIVTRRSF